MKQTSAVRSKGTGALELIEEAVGLLHRAPVDALALYYLGTLPFVLGLLYFWADMSRNADADSRLAGASLGMALLFIWMKYWQSRFCGGLSRLILDNTPVVPATDVVPGQLIFHSWSLLVLPAAFIVTLPFGWCFAFFQNITVLGGSTDPRRLYTVARRQAQLWQGQNHILMFVFILLGIVVFANLCISAYFFPRMLKTLFGIDSFFTRSNLFLLNSTFWVSMAVLAWLCIDPLVKAAYLLRCHYGESIASGADLLAEFKQTRRLSGVGILLLMLSATALMNVVPPAMAADTGQPAPPTAITAGKLDKTIEQVISGPEFAWRLPRTAQHREEMPGFIRSAVELVKEWAGDLGQLIKRFFSWLADLLPRFKSKEESASTAWGFPHYVLPAIYVLLALCLSVGAVLLWRQVRRRRAPDAEAAPSHLVVEPDVSDENVMADELSEDRWSALARELFAKGELRLGMRALYLACLACLAQEQLIAIARFKSNRDYERELGRFAHVLPEVTGAFSRNVALFEQAWYGMHRLEQELLDAFMTNHERILKRVRQG